MMGFLAEHNLITVTPLTGKTQQNLDKKQRNIFTAHA